MNFASVSNKNWIFKKYNNNKALQISEKFSLKEITSRLLAIRNIKIEDINLFLNPTIKNTMPNPFKISDMQNAVSRIITAIDNNETLGVFGDYDVDGAASTALLVKYFKSLKLNVKTYIPDRKKDGYGPNIFAFNHLMDNGCKIIITVDCGTSSIEPINHAQKNGVDVIVLDHHQSDIVLPKAHSIVNPNRIDDNSNLNYLCAAGVCFMFLVALNNKLKNLNWFSKNDTTEPNLLNSLDLVCLGTVCDVVPLVDLNRAIVSQGLKIIKKRSNLGLKTLYDICNIENQPNTYHVGYLLGPRINAGGRVGKSSYGVELLTSNNSQETYKIANELNNYNIERQNIEKALLTEVVEQAEKNKNDPVLFLYGSSWHEGVIGIIASRIKDKYNKPTFIISLNESEGKGSARSIYGFDVGSAIIAALQQGTIMKGGGHKMAGGFSIKRDRINEFKDFLIKRFNKINLENLKLNDFYLDASISPNALNEEFYNEISLLSPFGQGNLEPTFVIEDLKIINASIVGDKHIRTIMHGKNGEIVKAIAFNSKGGILEGYLSSSNKKKLNIAGKLSRNTWQGKKSIEFIIQDIALK